MRSKPDSVFYMLAAVSGIIVLLASGFVFVDAPLLHSLTREAFRDLCHQFSFRSFSGDGSHMAVCARCFGIYSGFFASAAGGLLVWKRITLTLRTSLLLTALAVFINIADVGGNLLGFWTNTLGSRFFAGLFAGISLILIIFTAGKHHSN